MKKPAVAALVLASLLLGVIMVAAKDETYIPELGGEFQMTEQEGTHFESGTVVIDSSEPVKAVLEAVLEMVTMQIESVSGAASSEMTLSGFAPLTTYHKYEDDYHNHVAFNTDASGKYLYVQDLSKPHFVFIQTRPSTKFIGDNPTGGDCASVGIWDPTTKTCTLTTDLNETIQIDGNNVTLDGNGHTLTGYGTGYGVYLYGKSGVTIKNLIVKHFSSGILLWNSNTNFVTDNTASFNEQYGIRIFNSNNNLLARNSANSNNYARTPYADYSGILIAGNNNTLTSNMANLNIRYGIYLSGSNNNLYNNSMTDNQYNFMTWPYPYYAYNNSIDTSNTVDGKPIYYVKNAINQVYDSSTNAGTFYCMNCNNVTIRGLTASGNGYGLVLWNTNNSLLENNNVSASFIGGISLWHSNNNTLQNNTASSNIAYGEGGFYITQSSNNNYVVNNTANSNGGFGLINSQSSGNKVISNAMNLNRAGIHLKFTDNNIIADNNLNLNRQWGILSAHSNNNTITDNIANWNGLGGFIFYNDTNEIVENNIVNLNNKSGIELLASENNTLIGNTLNMNNYTGIHFNTQEEVIFIGPNEPESIFYNSSNNDFEHNTIKYNGQYGIKIEQFSDNNEIYNNNFADNTVQAYVYGNGSNVFNLLAPIGGNYWSDYDTPVEGCDDLNGDNFCDAPYVFDGGQDNLPWARQEGWLDGIPPTTTDNAPSDWQNADFTVLLTCTDNPGGSGCKETKYAIDGGAWQTGNSVSISAEGDYLISYYSIDNMGNQESVKSTHAKLDKTPPATEASLLGGTCYADSVNVTLLASDVLSGVAATYYQLDGAEWRSYTGTFAVTDEGTHLLKYLSSDKANNYETEKSANFKIDRTPPEAIVMFDTASKDIKVYNSETGSEAGYTVLPSKKHDDRDEEKGWTLRQYALSDCANNSLVLLLKHKTEGNEVKVKIVSLRYNGGEAIVVTKNQIGVEYSTAKDGGSLKELEQKIEVKNAFAVKAKYSAKKNETEIKTKLEGQKGEQKETKPGLVALELLTFKGTLTLGH